MANVLLLVVPSNYTENQATPTHTDSTMCMQQKLYQPHPTTHTITDHSLYFFKTRFVTSCSYLLHHPLTLKAIGFAGNVRNRFSSDQCKDILPVCGRLSMKKTTSSLIFLLLLKYPFFAPTPDRLPFPPPLIPQTLLKRQIGA